MEGKRVQETVEWLFVKPVDLGDVLNRNHTDNVTIARCAASSELSHAHASPRTPGQWNSVSDEAELVERKEYDRPQPVGLGDSRLLQPRTLYVTNPDEMTTV